jgi:hypothetical protein
MTARRTILITAALLAGTTGWYLFRPERLFIDQRVDEPFPVAAQSAPTMDADAMGPTTTESGAMASGTMESGAMDGDAMEGGAMESGAMRSGATGSAMESGAMKSGSAMASGGSAMGSSAMPAPSAMGSGSMEARGAMEQPGAMKERDAMEQRGAMEQDSAMGQGSAMEQGSAMRQNGAMSGSAMAMHDSVPVALASGRFHSNAHPTQGQATVYRLPDGRRVLRLTGFETSNGPDVRVYLVAADDVQDDRVRDHVDLGALKGNIGDQNYDIPTEVDLGRYRSVSIWCRRFSVNFGAAPLAANPS